MFRLILSELKHYPGNPTQTLCRAWASLKDSSRRGVATSIESKVPTRSKSFRGSWYMSGVDTTKG